MARDGFDLVLTAKDGSVVVIEGYFAADPAPMLVSPQGAGLTPELINAFVHQAGNVQVAEADTATDASPVGTVKEVSGHATVTHPDGTKETVMIGMPIHEGDIIETDAAGAVNIVFIDESSFAVSENAKMAIDQYVFDPGSDSGESSFSMLRGLFVYTSGLIGREDPDDVKIDTPVGSIGIRGTVIAGNVTTGEITVMEGAIVLHSLSGQEVTLSGQYETAKFDGQTVTQVANTSASEIGAKFSSIGGVAPGFFSSLGTEPAKAGQDSAPASNSSHDGGDPANASPGDMPGDSGKSAPDSPASSSQNAAPQSTQGSAEAPPPAPAADLAPAVIDFGAANAFVSTNSFSDAGSFSTAAPVSVTVAPPPPAPAPLPAPAATAPAATTAPPPVIYTPPPAPLPPNAAPTATSAAFTLNENAAANSIVGTFTATDTDVGQTLTYAITGGNTGNAFTIDSATGVIRVAGLLDYESTSAYNLTVTATDNGTGSLSVSANVAITVGNINDAPVVQNGTMSVAENSPGGTAIGTVVATDQDAAQSLTYAIIAGNTGGVFAINASTGAITLANPVDREGTASYTLTVQATDNAGTPLSSTGTITVTITDVNDNAPVITGSTFGVMENSATGTAVGTATATDADSVGVLTYSIIGGTGSGLFAINSATGAITVNGPLDYEMQTSYTLNVQVSDGLHTPVNATYTINIGNDTTEFLSLNTLNTSQGFYIRDDINEKFGSGFAAMGDLNNDGFDDVMIVKGINDLMFKLQGAASSTSTTATALANSAGGFSTSKNGVSIASAGDFNGDGVNDIIIGAPHSTDTNGTPPDSGQAILKLGSKTITLEGLNASDLTGKSVAGIGDVNHDGYDDVIVGAPGSDLSATNGGAAYVLFGNNNVVLNPTINVTAMNDVRVVGSQGITNPADFVIKGNFSFAVSPDTGNPIMSSLNIIDNTNPAAPTMISINSGDVLTQSGSITDGLDGAQAIAVVGNYAYIASALSSRMTVIDISNPASPTYVGTYQNASLQGGNDIAVQGNLAIITSATTGTVTLMNVSSPGAPSLYATYTTGINSPTAVVLSGQYAYIASSGNTRLVTLNVSTPSTPTLASAADINTNLNGVSDMFIDGTRLYITAAGSDTLLVYDISTPGDPSLLGTYTNASIDGASSVVVSHGIAYVTAANSDQLVMLDIRNPASIQQINAYQYLANTDGASAVAIDDKGLIHITGQISGSYSILDTTRDGVAVGGSAASDQLGMNVSRAGDFNNDGIADFAMASPGMGKVDIIFGSKGMDLVALGTDGLRVTGISVDATTKDVPLFYAGDMNGDGIADMAIGATGGNAGKGLVHVIYGSSSYADGSTLDVSSGLNGTNGYTITTGAATQEITSGGTIGDFNGDGKDDLAVILKNPGEYTADIYVVFGGNAGAADGTMTLAELNNGANALHMTYTIPGGVTSPDDFHFTVSAAGDMNGDGFQDFVIGLSDKDTNATADSSGDSNNTNDADGEAIVILGHATGNNVQTGTGTVDNLTASVSGQALLGGGGNDNLDDNGLNNVAFRGGAGNDIIGLRNGNFSDIDGGAGTSDTIKFLLTSGTLDFNGIGAEKIQRIETLDLGSTGQTMQLTLNNIFGMMDSSDNGKLLMMSSGSASTNTIQIDNMGSGAQVGANKDQIARLLGADHVTLNAGNYDFQFGGHTMSINQGLVDNGHVNIA